MFPARSSASERDFLLRRTVQHESLARGRDAIDQPAAIGTGDQIFLRVEGEDANVGFVALEKDRMLAFGRDAIDFSVVAGGYVEVAGLVQRQVPDVFRTRLEID